MKVSCTCTVDPFTFLVIFYSKQWSTTGPSKAGVGAVEKCISLAACGKVNIKDPLLLIRKSSLCDESGFPLKKYIRMTMCLTCNSQ